MTLWRYGVLPSRPYSSRTQVQDPYQKIPDRKLILSGRQVRTDGVGGCCHALPAYGLEEGAEIFGDQVEGVARWTGGPGLSGVAGRPVRLRSR